MTEPSRDRSGELSYPSSHVTSTMKSCSPEYELPSSGDRSAHKADHRVQRMSGS
jgi:hypothetical protein